MDISVSYNAKRGPSAARPLRILTFTTLYPGATQPSHGIFVETRLRHLLETGRVQARVVAPTPWFPFSGARFGRYAAMARMPARELRSRIEVLHPRYLIIPKIGMSVAPSLLFAACLPVLRRMQAEFDLIDAHYFFPDGVAAVRLGQALGKPVVVTARGTDINLIPRHPLARRMIRNAARHAAGIIAVSQALKDAIVELGIPSERTTVLRNGVDLELFRPGDRAAARKALQVQGPVLLSVGHLIERKGHDLIIAALSRLPTCTLLIAGEGPENSALKAQAAKLGVGDRVRFLGVVPHNDLRRIYMAADALVLASSREGWPNVLLESMACGTPVIASAIWGNPEVVSRPEAGLLLPARTPDAIADAVDQLLRDPPGHDATRAYAEQFSWDETSWGQVRLFERILGSTAE